MAAEQRKRVAVLFGGRSVEHEISVISALQMMEAIDVTKFEPIPVYLALNGKWYCGEPLLKKDFYKKFPSSASTVDEVRLLPIPGQNKLELAKKSCCSKHNSPTSIKIDIIFPLFHGQYGEDGCVQGLLEMTDIPYTGCRVLSAAASMNKYLCKQLVSSHGIPVLPATLIEKSAAIADFAATIKDITSTKGLESFPLFVKPNNLGSSVGVTKVNELGDLAGALAKVFKFDTQALIEPCLTKMFEINISVLDGEQPTASVVEIPVPSSDVLTYEDKYMRSGGKKGGEPRGMAGLTRIIDPKDLNDTYKNQVKAYALKAFKLLECSGVVRFDFIVDNTKGQIYFNELNSIPGSLSYYLWEKSNPRVLYTELINRLIDRAIFFSEQKASLQRDRGFRALA